MSKVMGRTEDLGDVLVRTEWLVKGRSSPWRVCFKVGAHLSVLPSQRPAPGIPTHTTNPERIDLIMDLGADKKVELAAQTTDEFGHAVPAPEGTAVTWSVDNTEVIDLSTNEDGSASAAATGMLGNAVVSVEVNFPDGGTTTGDLLISVVPGEAERVVIAPGAVEEVTPDAEPAPAPEMEEPTEPETPAEPEAPVEGGGEGGEPEGGAEGGSEEPTP